MFKPLKNKTMTKEELIKIYSAYFPYDLKVKHSDYEREIDSICRIVSLSEDEIIIANSENDYVCHFNELKPIIYDLSYLTKEIEHNGERFIPAKKLGLNKTDCIISFENDNSLLYGNIIKTTKLPYDEVQKLLEWHFNIFNIPENEFINKANLKTE